MNLGKTFFTTLLLASGLVAQLSYAQDAQEAPNRPECVAPAQPGGGFDLTCRLIVNGFSKSKVYEKPIRTTYMPGGIGAVAYNAMVTQFAKDGNKIVAFSAGSLLNLANGKFGKYDENAVRWVSGIGMDYGAVTVSKDSPYKDLKSLFTALKSDPSKVVFGAGGSVGSQDWMKAALIAKASGVDYKKMRFVAFEGGGEGATALRGGHVQVLMGDAAEAASYVKSGAPVRVLAVLSPERLQGVLKDVPTAKEQSYDIQWETMRGFYLPPKVSQAQYDWWLTKLREFKKTAEYQTLLERENLSPYLKDGAEFEADVKKQVQYFRQLSKEFNLIQ